MRNPRPCECGHARKHHEPLLYRLDCWQCTCLDYRPAPRKQPLRAPGHVGPARIKRVQEVLRSTGYTSRLQNTDRLPDTAPPWVVAP